MLARRRRRARAWLAVTVALHVSVLALTVALLPLGRFERVESLVIIIALAVGPLAGMLWLQRHRPSAHQPHRWPWQSLAVAFPQAIALGFAVNAVLERGALERLLLILAVALLPAVTAEMARRALLRPLIAELGAGDVEVLVEPRTGARPWFYGDSIALTDREIVITVRSGSGRATWNPKTERIALADVTAVGARPVLPSDSPWITLPDGRGLSAPPGDVVVVRCGRQHRAATQVLPVTDAAVFAEVVRTRATRVRGTPVAALPVEVDAPPPVQEHVPEVLPAPEPSGPAAHPVIGPVDPPRTGPGMTARWGLGFSLALLGIVGVPVGLLLSGGLLPPETDLARYRLAFCALWTALAAGIWLRSVQQPRYWPVWALTSGLATAIIVAVHGLGLSALLGPVVGVLLTWAGRRVLIRPVGTDLAGSRLEIPLRLPGGATLLVQRDRMVLKVPGGAGGVVPQALALGELALAQPGQFAGNEVRWWPLPGARMRIRRGPVLRLVSGRQQWLLPVDDPRELAAIIRARAGTVSHLGTPLTLERWHELQAWAARQLTTDRRSGGLRQRTVGFRLAVAFPLAFLGTGLFNESIARGASLGSGTVVATAALATAAALVADWVRVRRRLRVAADHALPPGSPDWGELRPDHAPLGGWQPWWNAKADWRSDE
ncbi:MAG TPA: hypothetical protein VK887_03520 [Pseudonocardiaceae bacterium]|nr:hypothetical protein [Pseudonocardiaceae bacterium]